MGLLLGRFVDDFALALKAVDADLPRGPRPGRREQFKPGLGPLDEVEAVSLALTKLKAMASDVYGTAEAEIRYPAADESRLQWCDLVVPHEWAIEIKMLRPYRDNGDPEPAWAKDILSPYERDGSAVADAVKLSRSAFKERKAIVIYGLAKADDSQVDLRLAAREFELAVNEVVGPLHGVRLGARHSAPLKNLKHEIHREGAVFGWEVLAFG